MLDSIGPSPPMQPPVEYPSQGSDVEEDDPGPHDDLEQLVVDGLGGADAAVSKEEGADKAEQGVGPGDGAVDDEVVAHSVVLEGCVGRQRVLKGMCVSSLYLPFYSNITH